jgi:nitroimidazol reductase NimA-like FMN-containing flavoprotein (pyridoxamine 5'-phosphate oxidase superfamily)
MATVNPEGFPVIKPVNYLYRDGKVYIHSSQKGEKIEDIRRGSLVCFEVDDPIAYVAATGPACGAGYYYRSIIIKGRAALLEDRHQKLEVLEKLMEKYQPEGGYGAISEEILEKTAVIQILADEITGKEKLR